MSQRINFILQTQLSKEFQSNILKLWNCTKNKICHISFDNNLQKLFPTRTAIYPCAKTCPGPVNQLGLNFLQEELKSL